MTKLLAPIVRIVAFAGGISALYAGTLLYENELGEVQNKLEEWWVWFDDQQKAALSKAALFMRATVTLIGRILDSLFGEKLISFQAIIASICYSIASLFVVPAILVLFSTSHLVIRDIGLFAAFLLLGVLSARSLAIRVFAAVLMPFLFVGLVLFENTIFRGNRSVMVLFLETPIFLLAGVLCDIGFIALTRWLLHKCRQLNLAISCFAIFLSNVALGLYLFVVPVYLLVNRAHLSNTGFDVMMVGITNGLAFLVSLLLISVAVLLLLHRILWPIAVRLLYVVAPSKTQRVLLILIGTSLLTMAFGEPFSDEMKEFLKSLSGA